MPKVKKQVEFHYLSFLFGIQIGSIITVGMAIYYLVSKGLI